MRAGRTSPRGAGMRPAALVPVRGTRRPGAAAPADPETARRGDFGAAGAGGAGPTPPGKCRLAPRWMPAMPGTRPGPSPQPVASCGLPPARRAGPPAAPPGHGAVTRMSSRPISMRRISEVPAPISISFASR